MHYNDVLEQKWIIPSFIGYDIYSYANLLYGIPSSNIRPAVRVKGK